MTALDEARGVVSLPLYGHRVCPALAGTLYALGSDSARRHGLPPSASVTVPGVPGSYTHEGELPVRGTPQNDLFDRYTLVLGLIPEATFPDGRKQMSIPARWCDRARE